MRRRHKRGTLEALVAKMKATTLLLILAACRSIRSECPRQILEGPETQVVPSDVRNVTFNCRIKGEQLEWTINGTLNDGDRNLQLYVRGVRFIESSRVNGEINASITFPNTLDFNSTQVICVSLNATGTISSPEAVMIIPGPPLAPAPRLEVWSTTSLKVSWDEPFTWDLLPVLSYQLTVSSGTYTNTYSLSGSQRSQVVTGEPCSNLILHVSAINRVGMSAPGNITGEMPAGVRAGLGPAVELVKLILSSDGQAGIAVCVKLPVLCEFQRVEYSVVFSRGGGSVLELYREFNYSNGYTSECIEEKVDQQLEEGVEYSVQVFVNAGESGNSSSPIHTFRPPLTAKATQPSETAEIPTTFKRGNGLSVGLVAGLSAALSLLVGVVLGSCGMWCCMKKRGVRHEDPNNIYDVPDLSKLASKNVFPLSDNEAYVCTTESKN